MTDSNLNGVIAALLVTAMSEACGFVSQNHTSTKEGLGCWV